MHKFSQYQSLLYLSSRPSLGNSFKASFLDVFLVLLFILLIEFFEELNQRQRRHVKGDSADGHHKPSVNVGFVGFLDWQAGHVVELAKQACVTELPCFLAVQVGVHGFVLLWIQLLGLFSVVQVQERALHFVIFVNCSRWLSIIQSKYIKAIAMRHHNF